MKVNQCPTQNYPKFNQLFVPIAVLLFFCQNFSACFDLKFLTISTFDSKYTQLGTEVAEPDLAVIGKLTVLQIVSL